MRRLPRHGTCLVLVAVSLLLLFLVIPPGLYTTGPYEYSGDHLAPGPPYKTPPQDTAAGVRYVTYNSGYGLEPGLQALNHSFVVYVMSAIDEVQHRRRIRSTWADPHQIRRYRQHKFHVQIMYVVGGLQYVTSQLARDVISEHDQFGDMLSVTDLKDAYINLTEKTLYALEYVTRTIPSHQLEFILKVDSDNFINIFKWLALAWSMRTSGSQTAPDFVCFAHPPTPVLRTGKYAKTEAVYPKDSYPSYCSGPGYMVSSRVISRMRTGASRIPIMQSEDVMLTGIAMEMTGGPVQFHNLTRKYIYYNKGQLSHYSDSHVIGTFTDRYYAHQLRVELWERVYRTLVDYYLESD
jgi:hypothetical protein